MENQVERLVEKAWKRFQETPQDQRLLIGIAGIPGSGKTTLAQIVAQKLNKKASAANPGSDSLTAFLPMDGFHLTRAALSAMPDPITAHARRGAAFTFDAAKFLSLVQALRLPLSPTSTSVSSSKDQLPQPILAPSFDHAIKDPKDNDIVVLPSHRIVVLEGLYLALDKEIWRDAGALLDELWFVEVDFDVARKRLRERHVRAGIAKNLEEGDKRAKENDLVNGEEIVNHRLQVHEVIQSKEDGSWVHE